MAERPIFIPFSEGDRFVREETIEFDWNPGFAVVQKKKNISALHVAAAEKGYGPVLEVSTKSDVKLGNRLSAFNMPIILSDGSKITIECAFQGGKVFERGGPFQDLYSVSSREAKRDPRIKESGEIVNFVFDGMEFPKEPKTAFYDWLYVRALQPYSDFLERLSTYSAFSDIEFNPAKSINCQARSCALFVSLSKKGLIEEVIDSPENFIATVAVDSFAQPYSEDLKQGRLF